MELPNSIKYYLIGIACIIIVTAKIQAQSLLEMLEEEETSETTYAIATFKSTRFINGQTIETAGKNQFNFMVSHRFGAVSLGSYEYFGLDQSYVRIGGEYGINDRIDIGIGHNTDKKLNDSYIKIKLLRQSSGSVNCPFSLNYYGNFAYSTLKWNDPDLSYQLSDRMYFVQELIVAKKINPIWSIQLTAGYLHRNLVRYNDESNTLYFGGLANRIKLNKRTTFNVEYYHTTNLQNASKELNLQNPLSFGFDFETGGHVFQLHFSNSRGMTEKAFLSETTGKWLEGDIHFGFNIIRVFDLN